MTRSIPAIVMTCQRYIPITEHMIDCYDAAWPAHPFTFRVPDGEAARQLERRHRGRVDLVPTGEGEGRGRFRAAVLGLLDGLADDDWVYWCIDDKYVTWIDTRLAMAIADILPTIDDPRVSGLSFARARHLAPLRSHGHDGIQYGLQSFDRRVDYRQIWLHQFLRAKVLRTLFAGFPERIDAAKDMDALHRGAHLPDDQRLYVLDRNAVVFGESTSRGRLTANCAASMRRGRGVPEGFEIDERQVFVGSRPSLLGRVADRVSRYGGSWLPAGACQDAGCG
jgi:hypothetical protein